MNEMNGKVCPRKPFLVTITADKNNFQKNSSSATEKSSDAKKPVVPAVPEVTDEKSAQNLSVEPQKAALIQHEPIHFHILPPNEPHPCDKYGCAREAKYQLGDGYYCHDPATKLRQMPLQLHH